MSARAFTVDRFFGSNGPADGDTFARNVLVRMLAERFCIDTRFKDVSEFEPLVDRAVAFAVALDAAHGKPALPNSERTDG